MTDISLALRIRADVREATQALDAVGRSADDLGKRASRAGRDTASLRQDLDVVSQGVEDFGQRAAGAGDRVDRLGRRAQRQIRQLGELDDALRGGISSVEDIARAEQQLDFAVAAGIISLDEQAAALKKLDAEEAKLNRTFAKQERAIQSVLRRFDPTSAALKQLERDERALNEAVKSGLITAEQRNRALVGLETQRQRLRAVDQQVAAGAESVKRFGLESIQAQRAVLSLGRALAAGDFGGATQSIISLGAATRTTRVLFSPLGLAIGGVVAALGGFVAIAVSGERRMDELNRAVIATGGSIGATADELEGMIDSLDASNRRIGANREAVLGLARSGALTAESLRDAATAAVNLSLLTGRSIEQTTAQIVRLAREPVAGIRELDREMNLLTASVFAQIQELERQGRTQDAVRLATQALGEETQRRVDQTNERLGLLLRGLRRVQRGWRVMWEAALNVGAPRTIDEELDDVEQRIEEVRQALASPIPGLLGVNQQTLDELIQRRDELRREQAEAERKARQDADDAAVQAAGKAAADELGALLDQAGTKSERLNRELEKVKQRFIELRESGVETLRGLPLEEAERRARAVLTERFRDSPARSRREARDPSAAIIEGLERQLGLLEANSEQARILFEIESGGLRTASRETQQLAIDLAQLTDSERARLATEKEIAALTPQLLRDVGREAEASALEIEQRFGQLRRNLELFGRTEDLGLLDQALGIRAARSELDQLEQQLATVQADAARREQTIQTQLQARLITEGEARSQIVDLQREQADLVEGLLPRMEALAQATGDPAAIARVQQIRSELERMRVAADLLTQTLVTGFESGLERALISITERTAGLRQAAVGFILDIARALNQLAAQQLAQLATTRILRAVRGGGQQAAGAAATGAAITTAAATAAPVLGAGVTAGAATAAPALATGVVAGAGQAAITLSSAIVSAGGIAASEMAAAIAGANAVSGLPLPGLAGGGYTGDGGKYTPAGIVHRGEYVHRAEVVRQPGMLGLLESINREGMRAIERLVGKSPLRHAPQLTRTRPRLTFAEGGLVAGVPAPVVQNRLRVINLLDTEDMARRVAATAGFERSVLNVIRANPRTIRQELA